MERKTCNKCLIEKDISNFHKGKTKDGYQYICKQCKVHYANENKDNENERKNRWRSDNIEKVRVSKKKYYDNNKEKEYKRNYEYYKNKKKTNPIFKLCCNLRTRIFCFLNNKDIKKTNSTFNIVGCDKEYLKNYLEKKFVGGMCWKNYGMWHVDHIIPLSSGKNEDEIIKLCHHTNLQPLWGEDNLKKGKKLMYF
jgi:hypothetical protein